LDVCSTYLRYRASLDRATDAGRKGRAESRKAKVENRPEFRFSFFDFRISNSPFTIHNSSFIIFCVIVRGFHLAIADWRRVRFTRQLTDVRIYGILRLRDLLRSRRRVLGAWAANPRRLQLWAYQLVNAARVFFVSHTLSRIAKTENRKPTGVSSFAFVILGRYSAGSGARCWAASKLASSGLTIRDISGPPFASQYSTASRTCHDKGKPLFLAMRFSLADCLAVRVTVVRTFFLEFMAASYVCILYMSRGK
jgi:hypothetical protein